MAQKKNQNNKKNSDLTKITLTWQDGTVAHHKEDFLTKEQIEDVTDRINSIRRMNEQREKEKLEPSETTMINYLEGYLPQKSQNKLEELKKEFKALTLKEKIPFYGISIPISIKWDTVVQDWVCYDNSTDYDYANEQIVRMFPEGNVINKKLLGELQLTCPSLEVNKTKQKKLVKEWYKKCTAWVKEELKKQFNPEYIDSLADINYVIECVFDCDSIY